MSTDLGSWHVNGDIWARRTGDYIQYENMENVYSPALMGEQASREQINLWNDTARLNAQDLVVRREIMRLKTGPGADPGVMAVFGLAQAMEAISIAAAVSPNQYESNYDLAKTRSVAAGIRSIKGPGFNFDIARDASTLGATKTTLTGTVHDKLTEEWGDVDDAQSIFGSDTPSDWQIKVASAPEAGGARLVAARFVPTHSEFPVLGLEASTYDRPRDEDDERWRSVVLTGRVDGRGKRVSYSHVHPRLKHASVRLAREITGWLTVPGTAVITRTPEVKTVPTLDELDELR